MGCAQSFETSSDRDRYFLDRYELGRQLGKGSFAIVQEGKHKASGKLYAVKVCKKLEMKEDYKTSLDTEVQILRLLDHKNITRLYGNYQDNSHFYLVLELMEGGNLLDRMVNTKIYSERGARDACKQILEAVDHCHFHKVVHRDIKPDNLLLVNDKHDAEIKLGDFGFASFMFLEDSLKTQCGTSHYVAPEIFLGKKYGSSVDMWSIGIVVFVLLRGTLPFRTTDLRALAEQILKGEVKVLFDDEHWNFVSSEAKEFISLLLNKNPYDRLTAPKALKHSWITSAGNNHHLSNIQEELRRFNLKRKLRAAVFTLIAVNKFSSISHQLSVALDGLRD